MKCKDFEKRVLDLIEGKVDFKEKKFLERHILICDKCKNLYNDFVFILEKTKEIHYPELKEEFWKTKLNQIFEKKVQRLVLKPVLIGVFLFLLVISPIISKIYLSTSQKVPVSMVKTEIFNGDLPFTEEEIISFSDYMSEKEVERVLELIFSNF